MNSLMGNLTSRLEGCTYKKCFDQTWIFVAHYVQQILHLQEVWQLTEL